MSLSIQFSSLSMGASVDQQLGSLSVFEVIEELRAPQVPLQLPSMVLSLAMKKSSPHPFNGRMMIHAFFPDGKQQVLGNGDVQIPADQRRMKAVFRFGGFPIPEYGEYRLVISLLDGAGHKVGEAIHDFEVLETPATQSQNPPGKGGPGQLTH